MERDLAKKSWSAWKMVAEYQTIKSEWTFILSWCPVNLVKISVIFEFKPDWCQQFFKMYYKEFLTSYETISV